MEQEKIDRYVRDEMSADERRVFEQAMKQNDDIRKEVEFGKELKGFFANHEPTLESQLEKLGAEHFADKPSVWKKWWWLPILLAILGTTWYLLQPKGVAPENQMIDSSEEVIIEPPRQKAPEVTQPMPEATQESQNPIITPLKPIKKATPKPSQPIAALNPADFAANPMLESLMKEQVRNDGFSTTIQRPTPSQVYTFQDKILLQLKGTTTAKPPYGLTIYSNKEKDFEEGIGILTKELDGVLVEEEYEFSFSAAVPFERGLYYIFLQEQGGEEILKIEQFLVK